jgi:hypothetical protein
MNLDSIKEKVTSIFNSTPADINVGFGYKIKDGKLTDELAFSYLVQKKKSKNELSEHEILPDTIIHDGKEYKTDVIEIPDVQPFGAFCYGTGTEPPNNCFSFTNPSTPPSNRNYLRPIKGGIGISPAFGNNNAGTLGFVAVDIATQGLVGVTNNHVAIASLNDPFFTGERNLNTPFIYNELFPVNEFQNPATCDVGVTIPPYKIGRSLRYKPLYRPAVLLDSNGVPVVPTTYISAPYGVNYVDGALISLKQTDSNGQPIIDINESWKQEGLPQITTPPTFASLSELNSMVGGGTPPTNIPFSNTEIISAGRTTGPKQGSCSLRLHLLTCTVTVGGYNLQGSPQPVVFEDQMSVVRVNNSNDLCILPAYGGDSGSAVFAQFGGIWKIIGILFAGGVWNIENPLAPTNPINPFDPLAPTQSYTPTCIGYASGAGTSYFTFINKITNVASALGIEAWDGTAKPFVDPNSIQYVSTCGASFETTLTCSGDTYWQVGLTNSLIAPCNP